MENHCHLLADEIIKQDLPLALPGVRCQGKSIKGASVHVNFRPEANIVWLKVRISTLPGPLTVTGETNKPNKRKKLKKQKEVELESENLVMISTLESSMGAGAEMEACLPSGFGFVSCRAQISRTLMEACERKGFLLVS